jgi:hypothetical protein
MKKRNFSVKINGALASMTEDARADFIAEMRERGKTYGQISSATGMSTSNISWICLKYGIEGPRKTSLGDRGPSVVSRGEFQVRKFTPEEDAKITEMELAGFKRSAIARALGRKANSVLGRQMTLARREERAVSA